MSALRELKKKIQDMVEEPRGGALVGGALVGGKKEYVPGSGPTKLNRDKWKEEVKKMKGKPGINGVSEYSNYVHDMQNLKNREKLVPEVFSKLSDKEKWDVAIKSRFLESNPGIPLPRGSTPEGRLKRAEKAETSPWIRWVKAYAAQHYPGKGGYSKALADPQCAIEYKASPEYKAKAK